MSEESRPAYLTEISVSAKRLLDSLSCPRFFATDQTDETSLVDDELYLNDVLNSARTLLQMMNPEKENARTAAIRMERVWPRPALQIWTVVANIFSHFDWPMTAQSVKLRPGRATVFFVGPRPKLVPFSGESPTSDEPEPSSEQINFEIFENKPICDQWVPRLKHAIASAEGFIEDVEHSIVPAARESTKVGGKGMVVMSEFSLAEKFVLAFLAGELTHERHGIPCNFVWKGELHEEIRFVCLDLTATLSWLEYEQFIASDFADVHYNGYQHIPLSDSSYKILGRVQAWNREQDWGRLDAEFEATFGRFPSPFSMTTLRSAVGGADADDTVADAANQRGEKLAGGAKQSGRPRKQ